MASQSTSDYYKKNPGATAQDALQKFFDKYPARDQTTRMKKYKKQ